MGWVFLVFSSVSSWAAGPDARLATAQAAADAAMQRLRANLMAKMEKEGPAVAIPFCHSSAVPLTSAELTGKVLSVRRATLKARNPSNLAQPDEAKLLREWQARLERQRSIPAEWTRTERGILHYYRPIRTKGLCLTCHGQPEHIPPDVRAHLQKLYPNDEAIGYSPGDLRGLVHVTVQ